MKIHTAILFTCVFMLGCSVLRRAGYTAAGAGGGAAAGAAVAGPVGAGIGAAAGAVAAQAVGEAQELRDGETIGKGALEDQLRRQNDALKAENERYRLTIAELQGRPAVTVEKPVPFVPRWIWWLAAVALIWLKGHHLFAFLKTRDPKALFGALAPSWIVRKKSHTSS